MQGISSGTRQSKSGKLNRMPAIRQFVFLPMTVQSVRAAEEIIMAAILASRIVEIRDEVPDRACLRHAAGDGQLLFHTLRGARAIEVRGVDCVI